MHQRTIPSSKEKLPVIGIGTWKTFDVSGNSAYEKLGQTLDNMLQEGGRVIDTSPMYGRAEEVIGDLSSGSDAFFYATKVWTEGKKEGIRQMEASLAKMKRDSIDLMQIHNLVDWRTHMDTLIEWKEAGKIKYIGLTHYADAMHSELAKLLASLPVDFVQFNYAILSRNAEEKLLPSAAEHGIATIINRPFTEGSIISRLEGKSIPEWAKRELQISSWPQYFLKFIVSHPAVSCVIPGTGDPDHVAENMKAGEGPLPDQEGRQKMMAHVESLL